MRSEHPVLFVNGHHVYLKKTLNYLKLHLAYSPSLVDPNPFSLEPQPCISLRYPSVLSFVGRIINVYGKVHGPPSEKGRI